MIVDETFLAGKYVRNKKSFHSSYYLFKTICRKQQDMKHFW